LDHTFDIYNPSLKALETTSVILGTEGEGLKQSTIDSCDFTVKIPMAEGVDSLNVASASAVAFWELSKK
ncbi:MAG: RNA methyltransferase, partial [Ruminococcus sp.]|nr:RNA methyltransferase [Ruminococcus sp.]